MQCLISVWIVPYNDDIGQQLHLHYFYQISSLFPITTIDKWKKKNQTHENCHCPEEVKQWLSDQYIDW